MPRFIKNGPVVPDKLVQDLEEDRVVIFCGAGISMGAGLPSFKGLVDYCYDQLGEAKPKSKSFQWMWLDRMLGELEGKHSPALMRAKVASRLSQPSGDLAIHQAILALARLRKVDGIRLVTTNFDSYFETAAGALKLPFHSGPVLPIPRNDIVGSWKSVVYLHGRIEEQGTNDHLVLTSADFGRAYLTDAWAARFVTRLFADYTVLFIGYSLNDPVLRYMTDAFAAENSATASTPARGPAYIFVPSFRADPDTNEYTQRNLEPIFYDPRRRHVKLKNTLKAWAKARADYLTSTRKVIDSAASSAPNVLNPSTTNNLLWAVLGRKNDLGHGARIFADHGQTPPPVSWLDEFVKYEEQADASYQKALAKARSVGDLVPDAPPAPIRLLFPLASRGSADRLDQVSRFLIDWLLRHLGSVALVEWVIARLTAGRVLHPVLRESIRRELNKENTLKAGFIAFWRLATSESAWSLDQKDDGRFFQLRAAVSSVTLTEAAYFKQELLDALSPILMLKRSYYGLLSHSTDTTPVERGEILGQIADPEVTLAGGHSIELIVRAIDERDGDNSYWSSILNELTQLLVRTLDIYAIGGEASAEDDPSSFQRPSIVPHAQNRHRERWTMLIDRIWAGWTHLDATDPKGSVAMIEQWQRIPYLTFRRLVLAAVSHTAHLDPGAKLEFLAHD